MMRQLTYPCPLYDDLAMKSPREFSRLSLARQIDQFHSEYLSFEKEIHILILGTLGAANKRLEVEFDEDTAKITAGLDESTIRGSERLTDDLTELDWFLHDQQRFLLNMAVVGLASRLTHALRQMARAAETFSPRKKRYGSDGKDNSEFGRLWVEFRERFAIDVKADPNRVAFIEPLREVRNQIVHDGGVANPYKFKTFRRLDSTKNGKACRLIPTKCSISNSQLHSRILSMVRDRMPKWQSARSNSNLWSSVPSN
jgi:hypothetical protein